MKKRICLLTLIISFLALNSAFAQLKINANLIDSLVQQLEKYNKAMGSIAISVNGEIVYSKAFGHYYQTSLGSLLKSDSKVKYRIGSITKMFTSVMIQQLIEEGKLSLDTKLSRFYPKIQNADKITIEALLNHHSGLYNFTNSPSYVEWMEKEKSKEELLVMFEKQSPAFEPNEKGEYSNTNYVLLGYIIEELSSDSYANQIQKRICEKIGLTNTYYGKKIDGNSKEAQSYLYSNKSWNPATETNMNIPHGAGAIVSTPEDLVKFANALFTGKLISASSLKSMLNLKDNYGLGIFKFPFYDIQAFGHTGGIDGFQSNLAYFEKEKVAVSICFNGVNYGANDILIGVLSGVFNKPYKIPNFETIEFTEKELTKYEGLYSSKQIPLKMTIKKAEGGLSAQATGQPAFNLDAESDVKFTYSPVGVIIEFKKSSNGDIKEFDLKQGGGIYHFIKE